MAVRRLRAGGKSWESPFFDFVSAGPAGSTVCPLPRAGALSCLSADALDQEATIGWNSLHERKPMRANSGSW